MVGVDVVVVLNNMFMKNLMVYVSMIFYNYINDYKWI